MSGASTLEVIILASIVLTLGIFLMYLAISWMQAYSVGIAEEFDKHTQLMRSILVIEAVNYSDVNSNIYVRNVSKYNISITVCRIELFSPERSLIVNATPADGFRELARLEKSGSSANISAPTCTYCNPNEELIYRVWYAPLGILEKMNPSEMLDLSSIKIVEIAFVKRESGE